MPDQVQRCRICGVEKAHSEFYVRSESGKLRRDCKECCGIRQKAIVEANKEHVARRKQEWFERNKERQLQRISDWCDKNKERVLAAKRKYREANPVVDRVNTVKRRAALMNRNAPWADRNVIRFFYDTRAYMSADTGQQWHVDHIVPLRGKVVSGLHTHNNLRVIPAVDNMAKGNSFV